MPTPIELLEFETMMLSRHMGYDTRRGAAGDLLDRSAYLLLRRLCAQGPMTIAELSDAFGLDASTVNRQTAALVTQGWVRRIPDPDGAVARRFEVTDAGRDRLAANRRSIVGGLSKVLTEWDDADVEEFAGYLARFNTDIERISGRPWPRPAE